MADAIEEVVETTEEKEKVDAPEKVEETKEETKAYTQKELDGIIKSNVDRALAKAKKEQEEATKLAKMNADEKAKYEVEQREKTLKEREQQIQLRELTAEAKDILIEKGLPSDLHKVLNYESAETVNESIKTLESALKKAVEEKVSERLKGNPPKETGQTKVDAFQLAVQNRTHRRK